MEKLGQNNIYSQYLGNKVILRTYKGTDLINEYVPLYTPPVDWSDIRTDCPENSIALYVGVKSDYSAYDNLGFTATCTGGYKVYIDGEQYGSTYASGAQCTITWSTSGITTGDDITTPEALKAHKIWIEPATSGNNITAFHFARVASSGQEQQGTLWIHFNISNVVNLNYLCDTAGQPYQNKILKAATAKNNKIKVSSLQYAFYSTDALEYIPTLDGNGADVRLDIAFLWAQKIKSITLNNMTGTNAVSAFSHCFALEQVNGNAVIKANNKMCENCYALKEFPRQIVFTTEYNDLQRMLTNSTALQNTSIDTSNVSNLKIIGCYGSSGRFMSGFKGLRVSNQAPFDSATSPQINVSYTGMDRAALVQLFNDLPTVSAGQKIQITSATGASALTAEDRAIAENKGWEIMG